MLLATPAGSNADSELMQSQCEDLAAGDSAMAARQSLGSAAAAVDGQELQEQLGCLQQDLAAERRFRHQAEQELQVR